MGIRDGGQTIDQRSLRGEHHDRFDFGRIQAAEEVGQGNLPAAERSGVIEEEDASAGPGAGDGFDGPTGLLSPSVGLLPCWDGNES